MLSPPYCWRVEDSAAYLDFNFGNVASVQRIHDEWTVTIRYRGAFIMAPCASMGQGIRYVDRWIGARRFAFPKRRRERR